MRFTKTHLLVGAVFLLGAALSLMVGCGQNCEPTTANDKSAKPSVAQKTGTGDALSGSDNCTLSVSGMT